MAEYVAEQYGSHEALCDNKGSYSYESLNTSVKNLSIGFADMGLRKSDKVILQLDNCNEFVIVCFAFNVNGCNSYSGSSRTQSERFGYNSQKSKPSYVYQTG